MKKLIIFGTGPMAEVAHFYFTHDSSWEVVAFTEDTPSQESFCDLPVIPLTECCTEKHALFVAVGYSKRNEVRSHLYEKLKGLGFKMASYISSRSHIWTEAIGEHCFILENQTIQPFVTIGNNVVLWSGNHIGHHSSIGDHCFLASHVVVSGGVSIAPYTFIGVNATLRDGITIGEKCVIGSNACMMRSAPDEAIFKGPRTEIFEGAINL